jgi:hypothetical protein
LLRGLFFTEKGRFRVGNMNAKFTGFFEAKKEGVGKGRQ